MIDSNAKLRSIQMPFCTYTPSGVQGAPHPARLEKTDGTTTACGGHWYTTPAQVKTEKTARHP
ncbi:hypothetical protein MP846_25995 [Escherichia coli]|nr:hypothetical protein [Escherichia coli]MCW9983202.1 hypothetical protein [Escherichia coli]